MQSTSLRSVAWPIKFVCRTVEKVASLFKRGKVECESSDTPRRDCCPHPLDALKPVSTPSESRAPTSSSDQAPQTLVEQNDHYISSNKFNQIFLQIADLLDEMIPLQCKAVGAEKANLDFVAARLETMLEDHGVRLTRHVSWDPSQMRVVKVVPPESGEADYTVLETIESGAFVGTRLLRKQSVVITKRPSPA